MTSFMEYFSDTITIDKNKCIFCGECVERCLLDNVRIRVAPCRQGCPLDTNCQGYAQLIARGEFDHAAKVLQENLPFPGMIGRICPHPCETGCSRASVDGQAVSLRELKRFLADNAVDYTNLPLPEKELPQRVAIVGGGPAGIMAAFTLRKRGYQVEILEAGEMLGGAVARYVPQFRLPLQVVKQECDQLSAMGVQVRYGVQLGRDVTLDELSRDYAAVILATGCTQSRQLGLAHEDAANVYGALEFLAAAKQEAAAPVGKSVLVIGGGSVAMDAAATALRLGAEDVRVACLESREDMPAFVDDVQNALEEGIIIENKWGPVELIADGGQVKQVRLRKCLSVLDKDGRFAPLFAESQYKVLDVDTVIVAISQSPDKQVMAATGVAGANGLVQVDAMTMQTAKANVFAAGDAVSGPRIAIEAMAQGRAAAESVHRLLADLSLTYGRRDVAAGRILEFDVDKSQANAVPRACPSKCGSKSDFCEVSCSLSAEQAKTEASRCLSCGSPFGYYKTCWECLACEVNCPEEALEIHVPYLMR